MKIKLCGVRGSLPTPSIPGENSLLGGNTLCVEVQAGQTRLIIDGGSGIRHLIDDYADTKEVHLYLTHFHWDHLMGLPFFPPFYTPGKKIHIYTVQSETEEVLRTLFKRPYFPVGYASLMSEIHYHYLPPRKPYRLGDLTLTPYLLDHPDPCWGPRIEGPKGQIYAHAVDHEMTRMDESLGEDAALYQNADLLLFDAEYSVEEAREKANWGHSNALKGLQMASSQKVKKILFAHHDPMQSDQHILQRIEATSNAYLQDGGSPVNWEVAIEGKTFTL